MSLRKSASFSSSASTLVSQGSKTTTTDAKTNRYPMIKHSDKGAQRIDTMLKKTGVRSTVRIVSFGLIPTSTEK